MFQLRGYQKEAVEAGLDLLSSKKTKNGLLVEPTGTGKSLIIGKIIEKTNKKTILLQPTKEILEQNLSKLRRFGVEDIGIYSASMGEKSVGSTTIATIGTIIKKKEKFNNFDQLIIDEAHLCNSKGGQYEEFINHLSIPVIGLTATPFRMKYYMNTFGNGEPVVESRFLTRTRPRIFNTISHITQVTDMFNQGYLCPIDYDYKNDYDSKKIKSNSTGQGYNEESLEKYNKEQNIVSKIINEVIHSKAKHILIFTHFTSESKQVVESLQKYNISCVEVSGQTPKSDREDILRKFQLGIIRCVVNVGVLTVGFDFPELDHIIIGRPTKSLTLFYQISGRGLRLADGKECCKITDLCDNIKRFGEINSFFIEDISNGNELWRLKSNIGYLTGVNLITGRDLEGRQMTTHKEKKKAEKGELIIPFGKYKDKKLSEVGEGYLKWAIDNFDKGKWKALFKNELDRRNNGKPSN
jgi:DNA repair protein RadD